MCDMEITTNPEAKMNTTMNPVLAQINRTADDPSVAAHIPVPLAERLIAMVGGECIAEGPGHWGFPDGFWTWELSEALRYALEVMPDICE